MEPLDPVEARVLGALVEKEAATPEYYPLSLNALVNACNQKSNRYPVVNYTDEDVSDAILRLRAKGLAVTITGGSRVTKYGQRISETLNLGRRELAVLAVLLLRGPQTLGEIKDRSERLYQFADLDETASTLDRLAAWPAMPLTVKLPRQPGQKEARFAHLLSGEPQLESATDSDASSPSFGAIERLGNEVRALRDELADLKRRFDALESQLR
jgi:uncharacterized protein YceH (UPF0502 family)